MSVRYRIKWIDSPVSHARTNVRSGEYGLKEKRSPCFTGEGVNGMNWMNEKAREKEYRICLMNGYLI